MSNRTETRIDHGIAWITLDDGKVRLRTLDMPSFAATKARINERALQDIRAAVEDELRTIGPAAAAGRT